MVIVWLPTESVEVEKVATPPLSGPLPMEFDEPALEYLTRLVFRFNRRDHGRLRMLIDRLNDMA